MTGFVDINVQKNASVTQDKPSQPCHTAACGPRIGNDVLAPETVDEEHNPYIPEASAPSIRFYLIRHGESEWQAKTTTDRDSDLTDLGHEQAEHVCARTVRMIRSNGRPYEIISSPLKRSIQTVDKLGMPYRIMTGAREAPFDIKKCLPRFGSPSIYSRTICDEPRYTLFRDALAQTLGELVESHGSTGKDVYLFCHGGVIKTIFRIIHDNDAICYRIANGSISSLCWTLSRWHIESVNDVRHIPGHLLTDSDGA